MRMSSGVEWSIHSCALMAFLGPGQALPAARLAEYHGVPAPYLTKHLQAMVKSGICSSLPGPTGGFRLARDAADISLLDVTLAVDGDSSAFVCSEIRQRGPAVSNDPACYASACAIAKTMWRAESAWRDELASVTVADIVASLGSTFQPDQLELAAAWLDVAVNNPARGRPEKDEKETS